MSRKSMQLNRGPLGARRQHGMSTLLIVSVVALAVTGTTLASVYALRGSQQRQLTTHSMTTAQAAAWRGVEVLRAALEQLDSAELVALQPTDVTGAWLTDVGVQRARITAKNTVGTNVYRITAAVTGQAGQGSALTTSTVEVTYELAPGGSASTPMSNPVCASLPSAPMVFNGNLEVSGASLSVTNALDYETIAVAGDITLTGSSARLSGCAKGNVDVAGGGVTANGHLFAEGDIRVHSSSPPSGTTLWGRKVTLDGSSSGARYAALKAGAYAVSLVADSQTLGVSNIGGVLIPSTVSGGIPWVRGVVLPLTSTSPVEITLTDGSKFLLDLSRISVDLATGVVTGAAAAAEKISGQATMPDKFTFRSDALRGGGITAQGLTGSAENATSDAARTGFVWGHDVEIGAGNQGFGVVKLWANGHLRAGRGSAVSLVGGGDVWSGERWGANNYGNNLKVPAGQIAGNYYYGSSKTLAPAGETITGFNASRNVANTSPGLPGIPYCDARVQTISADAYRDAANYIFEFKNGAPTLTIQNVKTAAGVSLDGTYNMLTTDLRRMPVGTGQAFLMCNWQTDPNNVGAHCFRDVTATSGWNATGVTKFPRGVIWFDSAIKFDGTNGVNDADGNRDLINTIISKGKVNLTTAGHKNLLAPNFAGAEKLCNGPFWPSNLCDKSDGTSKLQTWTEKVLVDGVEQQVIRHGLPIGNVAVVTESEAHLAGWEIFGNVMLGQQVTSSANVVQIHGSLIVGANQPNSTTTITAGGAEVIVTNNTDGKYLPVCTLDPGTTTTITSYGASVRWSRYL